MKFVIGEEEFTLNTSEMEENFIPFRPFQIYFEDTNSFQTINDGIQWTAKISVPRDISLNVFSFLNSLNTNSNIQVYGFKKISDGTVVNLLKLSSPIRTESILPEEWGWSFEIEERFPQKRYQPFSATGSIIIVSLASQALNMSIPAIEFDEILIEKSYVYEYDDNTSEEELEAVLPVIQIDFKSLLVGEFLKAIIKERLNGGTIKITVAGSQFFSSEKTVRCQEAIDFKRHQKSGFSSFSGLLHFVSIDPMFDLTIDTGMINPVTSV